MTSTASTATCDYMDCCSEKEGYCECIAEVFCVCSAEYADIMGASWDVDMPYHFGMCFDCFMEFRRVARAREDDVDLYSTCRLCKRTMYDRWIHEDGHNYCRLCIKDEDIIAYLLELCKGDWDYYVIPNGKLKDFKGGELADCVLYRKGFNFQTVQKGIISSTSVFAHLISKKTLENLRSKQEAEKEKMLRRRQNIIKLRGTFSLEDDDITAHIVDTYVKGRRIPHFWEEHRRSKTLEWLLRQARRNGQT